MTSGELHKKLDALLEAQQLEKLISDDPDSLETTTAHIRLLWKSIGLIAQEVDAISEALGRERGA